jgi:hypothetical protein
LDLAFNDGILDDVEREWKTLLERMCAEAEFMKFPERAGMNDEDVDDNEEY